MQSEYVDQGAIASILEVDRSSILAFQKRGMPYKAGAVGESNSYDIGLVCYWFSGNKIAMRRQIRLTALEKILLAFARGSGHQTFAAWESRALSLSDWLNSSREEIATAAGFLSGRGLLPWSRS